MRGWYVDVAECQQLVRNVGMAAVLYRYLWAVRWQPVRRERDGGAWGRAKGGACGTGCQYRYAARYVTEDDFRLIGADRGRQIRTVLHTLKLSRCGVGRGARVEVVRHTGARSAAQPCRPLLCCGQKLSLLSSMYRYSAFVFRFAHLTSRPSTVLLGSAWPAGPQTMGM